MLTIKVCHPEGIESVVETKRYQWSEKYSVVCLDEGEIVVPAGCVAYAMNDKGVTIGKYISTLKD